MQCLPRTSQQRSRLPLIHAADWLLDAGPVWGQGDVSLCCTQKPKIQGHVFADRHIDPPQRAGKEAQDLRTSCMEQRSQQICFPSQWIHRRVCAWFY